MQKLDATMLSQLREQLASRTTGSHCVRCESLSFLLDSTLDLPPDDVLRLAFNPQWLVDDIR
jgi:hypothetical protein